MSRSTSSPGSPSGSDPSDRVFVSAFDAAQASGKVARGGALMIAANLLGFVVTLTSTAILARLLTPEAFGLIAMTATLTALLMMFSDAGLTQATIQRREITYGQLTALFWINLAVGAGLAVACFAAAPFLAWFYGEPGLTDVVRVLSVNFLLLGATAQFSAVINRQLRFKVTALVQLLAPIAGAAAALVFAWLDFGVWALVAQLVVTEIVRLGASVSLAHWFPGLPRRAKGVGQMLRFGGNQLLFNVVVYLVPNADRIFIGSYLNPHVLGLYDRSAQMIRLPQRLLIMPLTPVMLPTLSRLHDQPDAYRNVYVGAMSKLTMASFPLTIAIALLAPEIVSILLGAQWEEAVPIFAVLAISTLTAPISRANTWLWISQGRMRTQLCWGLLITSTTVPAYFVGVSWGAVGVAAGAAVAQLSMHPIAIWMATRVGPVSWRDIVGSFVPGIVGAIGMSAVILAIRATGLLPANPFLSAMILGLGGGIGLVAIYSLLPSARRPLFEMLATLGQWTGLAKPAVPSS
ncbi:lipopolysaccharide biosynthesis protein [Marinivivus vitaminiproducens]|uniref:lipopolysaccharide biosynthesis protein n=1 Tax=Marinivivus vitaminiproducens TaxID=3035935 RepID=UPI0027A5624E|nr:lipopolysaccharide biosynthesis protein [Geminicoccaceae bacterium SCSIO 64248]